jgi:hypothetical protein
MCKPRKKIADGIAATPNSASLSSRSFVTVSPPGFGFGPIRDLYSLDEYVYESILKLSSASRSSLSRTHRHVFPLYMLATVC